MQILTVDVGTGTQDIYLFQSGTAIENGFKLVMPSPTMAIRRKIQQVTHRGDDLLLVGVTMGGGPCAWAADEHVQAGLKLYATPEAARTFNDDLDVVRQEMGVEVVSHDEAAQMKATRIELRDFDYQAIGNAFSAMGVDLHPAAVAVAVFDHGAAPPGVSDRKFRFDYIESRLRANPHLSGFAYLSTDVPPFLTRMHAVIASAAGIDCPLVLMDTAPAAVAGAALDRRVGSRARTLVANVGNFHTLAFRLGPEGVEGVFEHHTGFLNLDRLDDYLQSFAAGTLKHEDVFADHGHGAFILDPEPLSTTDGDFGVAVTGPRQSILHQSRLRPYFAVPYGDMMLSGCFGLLSACADRLPQYRDVIHASLSGKHANAAPWD